MILLNKVFILTAVMTQLLSAEKIGEQVSESGIKHSFLFTGSKTMIVGEDCEIIWQHPGKSRTGQVLNSGNILIAFKKEVKEFTRDGEVVFHHKLSDGNQEISTTQRLENGNTLIAEMGPKPRILEINNKGKKVVEVPLQPETRDSHKQTRMARKLDSGNYIVPHLLAFAIKEYSPEGEVVKTIKTDISDLGEGQKNWPFTAIVLKDGNIYANLTQGNKSAIFSPTGTVLWQATNADVGNKYIDPCGAHYLDNGNVVIANYAGNGIKHPNLFEVATDKKIVWEYKIPKLKGAHDIQILTTNGRKVKGRR